MRIGSVRSWTGGLLAVAIAVLGMASQAQAQAQAQARVDKLEIVESGFYTAKVVGSKPAPGSVTGSVDDVEDITFLKKPPDTLLGSNFGVRFKVVGRRRNGTAKLRTVWKIPEPGIRNPENKNTYRESTAEFTVDIGSTSTRGYGFDKPWEVVEGEWVLQIWQDRRKLLEKAFTVR